MKDQPTSLSILIAEDDLALSRLIQKRLQGVGRTVEVVSDGGGALAWISEHSEYVLLLLDYRLPARTMKVLNG